MIFFWRLGDVKVFERVFRKLAKDEHGNFGIMSALLAPVLIGAGGVAIDVASMLHTKTGFQAAADAASLAASAALGTGKVSKQEAEQLASQFLSTHMHNMGYQTYESDIAITSKQSLNGSTEWTVDVGATAIHKNSGLSKVLGVTDKPVGVAATSVSVSGLKNAFSMYFVLDKSGSMLASTSQVKHQGRCTYYWLNSTATALYSQQKSPCYYTQIEALKNATNAMFDKFEKADPKKMYMRFGSVAYSDVQESNSALAWGVDNSRSNIDNLEAVGGTNSADAFKTAYRALGTLSEVTTHTLKNGVVLPKKYLVFMTDGENNSNSADKKTLQHCAAAKTLGITIYSIAFNAPKGGKELLSACASSAETYFDAKDADELLKAFESIAADAAGDAPRLTQ
ncbi:TadE/TadG family type IV pilus assembly protein [Rhizobium sp. MHM7A]|uniref:vWA domain-containing protein n=1 Tax=Rhizobium sp. MHM7A TaxID=2583233 RepID=UPI001486C908|nr:TadE/TadG family type IV pilus assembly protein [Rhizobium sp. MHM7A]